jgi:hypothetical protein
MMAATEQLRVDYEQADDRSLCGSVERVVVVDPQVAPEPHDLWGEISHWSR